MGDFTLNRGDTVAFRGAGARATGGFHGSACDQAARAICRSDGDELEQKSSGDDLEQESGEDVEDDEKTKR